MLVHPNIDPIAFSIGPLAVRWYGLMYLAGFAAAWWLGLRRIAKGMAPVTRAQFDDLLFLAVPWGMVFRGAGDAPRHPSQLYQFALEGVTLFIILYWFSSKPRPRGQVSALFLIGYGVLRFMAEFAREPDAFLGYLALGMTMGQWLCVPMIALGVWLWTWSVRR